MSTDITVVVTGVEWLGAGVGSIESALEELFREARREVIVSAYSVTSGADLIFSWMEAALARGVEVSFLVNRFSEQPQNAGQVLRSLVSRYPHFHLYDFEQAVGTDLHAKAIVCDRRIAVVGSSNLSRRGMLANYEIAVRLEGPHAECVAAVLDRVVQSHLVTKLAAR